MLVLARQRDESIRIQDDILVTTIDIRGDKVRLGFEAPRHVSIHREEVYRAIKAERLALSLPVGAESTQSDIEWWETCVDKNPFVKCMKGGWEVGIAPLNRTLSEGRTFLEAIGRCRVAYTAFILNEQTKENK